MVIVHDVIAIVPPATIVVVSNVRSPPPPVAVTEPSMTAVPPDAFARNQPAVPDASADVSDVIAFAVAVPELEDPNAVADSVKVPNNVPVAAVPGVAGCEPVRISTVPLFSRVAMASAAAFCAPTEIRVAIDQLLVLAIGGL